MNVNVEKLENNLAKIKVTVPAEEFDKACTDVYNKNRNRYNVQGFRKGHAPQKMVERTYGEGIFFEDALNIILDRTYPDAMKESGLDIVSKANWDIEQIGKGKDLIYIAEVATRPEVKLGNYKELEIEKADDQVSEEEVDKAIEQERNRNSRLVTAEDKAAENGNTVIIDFDGSVDGVHFDGGKGEDYSLELGSHTFIEGFEEQIIGHKAGDQFDVNVTFPEQYQAADLAGKPALFECVLKEVKVKEVPELDDEFASEVSEFETLDEYKADVRKKLEDTKKENAKVQIENAVVEAAAKASEVELPELMVQTRIDNMVDDYSRRMQAQGLKFEDYMKYTGMTMESFREQLKPQAETNLKNSLVLEEIAKAEGIEVSDEQVEEELGRMAESYNMEKEKLVGFMTDDDRASIKDDLKIKAAIEMLVSNAKIG